MNRTIRILMTSDFVILTGLGLVEPILSVFIKENITGATLVTAGLASTIYFVSKSLVQLPFSRYTDAHDHKNVILFLGTLFIAATPFLYFFAHSVNAIYISQLVYGIGYGIAYPCWLSIWSTHLDNHHEGFEWSMYSTLTGLGAALSAAIGASLAQSIGFRLTFLLVGGVCTIGSLILLGLNNEAKHSKRLVYIHYHHHRKAHTSHHRR